MREGTSRATNRHSWFLNKPGQGWGSLSAQGCHWGGSCNHPRRCQCSLASRPTFLGCKGQQWGRETRQTVPSGIYLTLFKVWGNQKIFGNAASVVETKLRGFMRSLQRESCNEPGKEERIFDFGIKPVEGQ